MNSVNNANKDENKIILTDIAHEGFVVRCFRTAPLNNNTESTKKNPVWTNLSIPGNFGIFSVLSKGKLQRIKITTAQSSGQT